MVQLIVGNKGKGKTKHLLDKVNTEILHVSGNIVYIDKSAKHMYELNNKVRLIDISAYDVTSPEEFMGFVKGIVSQDHDLQQMYFDSFLMIANTPDHNITDLIGKIEAMSKKFNIDFVISASLDESELDDSLKDKVIVSL